MGFEKVARKDEKTTNSHPLSVSSDTEGMPLLYSREHTMLILRKRGSQSWR